jgi:hypothetical protein
VDINANRKRIERQNRIVKTAIDKKLKLIKEYLDKE